MKSLIDDFLAKHQWLEDGYKAYGACYTVTGLFNDLAHQRGINMRMLDCYSYVGPRLTAAHEFWDGDLFATYQWEHHIAIMDDNVTTIDFTWRQFDLGGPVPRIVHIEQIHNDWHQLRITGKPIYSKKPIIEIVG